MQNFRSGLIATVALLAASSIHASASTYDFSYSFGPYGGEITGSFTGTGPITDVTDISNISVSYEGTPLTGPLNAFSYIGPSNGGCYAPANCFSANGVVASSIATFNNFVFINSNSVSDMSVFTPAFSNYFYMIPWGNGSGNPEAVQYYSGSFVPADQYNGDLIPQNWQLTEVAPLPSTWSLMIAGFVGLVGFVALGGKKRKVAAAAA